MDVHAIGDHVEFLEDVHPTGRVKMNWLSGVIVDDTHVAVGSGIEYKIALDGVPQTERNYTYYHRFASEMRPLKVVQP